MNFSMKTNDFLYYFISMMTEPKILSEHCNIGNIVIISQHFLKLCYCLNCKLFNFGCTVSCEQLSSLKTAALNHTKVLKK